MIDSSNNCIDDKRHQGESSHKYFNNTFSPTSNHRNLISIMSSSEQSARENEHSDRRIMNDSTMPPPKQRQSNTMTGAATVSSSSSATRKVNPRAQKGVAKGFGLYDWKLLLRKANDLAQNKGVIRRDITIEEVKQHNKVHDGWMVLRGKVYNIGPYLHYHPGGLAIMKPFLGRDATQIFDRYHRWVNIEGLVGPLFLGVLQAPMREEDARKQYSDQIIPTKESALNAPRVTPKAAANGSLLLPRPDDAANGGADEDEEEPSLLPPPPS